MSSDSNKVGEVGSMEEMGRKQAKGRKNAVKMSEYFMEKLKAPAIEPFQPKPDAILPCPRYRGHSIYATRFQCVAVRPNQFQ